MIKYAFTILLFASCSLYAQKRSTQYIGPDNVDVKDFCITPGGQYVYTAVQNSLTLYEILGGQQIDTYQLEDSHEIRSIALSSDSTFLVAGTDKGSIVIIKLIENSQESIQLSDHPVTSLDINAFNSRIVCGTADGELILTDMAGGSSERLHPHDNIVTDVEFSTDGILLLSSCMDGRVIVTDLSGGLDFYCLSQQRSPCRSIAINNETTGLLASYDNGDVYQWLITTNKEFIDERKSGTRGWITGVDYHRDGQTWASSNSSGKIEIRIPLGNKYTSKIDGVATRVKFCYVLEPKLCLLVSKYKGGLIQLPARHMKLK